MSFFNHWVGDLAVPFWGGFVGYIGYELAAKELQCEFKATGQGRQENHARRMPRFCGT